MSIVAASCILVVAAFLGIAAIMVSGTTRADVPSRELAAIDLTASNALSMEEWELLFAEQTAEFSRREWVSDNADLLLVEAWKHSGPIAAERFYFTDRVKPRYKREAPGYVEDFEPPETGADRENLFCGNVGLSETDQIEDCHIWGYWARYGQYILYLEVHGRRMPLADFRSLVVSFDRHILDSFESAG